MKKTTEEIEQRAHVFQDPDNYVFDRKQLDAYKASIIEGVVLGKLPSDATFGKPIEYWKNNAEEQYDRTPISVLKYISVLEYPPSITTRDEVTKPYRELLQKIRQFPNLTREYIESEINNLLNEMP
jgi:hypothetical protein